MLILTRRKSRVMVEICFEKRSKRFHGGVRLVRVMVLAEEEWCQPMEHRGSLFFTTHGAGGGSGWCACFRHYMIICLAAQSGSQSLCTFDIHREIEQVHVVLVGSIVEV
jgi:hypothetical protein